jgi:hypothetical protein
LSGIIVRKRSTQSETEDAKKSKIDEPKSADVIVSSENTKTLSTNGLGALAGLGNYSSDSDNDEEDENT